MDPPCLLRLSREPSTMVSTWPSLSVSFVPGSGIYFPQSVEDRSLYKCLLDVLVERLSKQNKDPEYTIVLPIITFNLRLSPPNSKGLYATRPDASVSRFVNNLKLPFFRGISLTKSEVEIMSRLSSLTLSSWEMVKIDDFTTFWVFIGFNVLVSIPLIVTCSSFISGFSADPTKKDTIGHGIAFAVILTVTGLISQIILLFMVAKTRRSIDNVSKELKKSSPEL